MFNHVLLLPFLVLLHLNQPNAYEIEEYEDVPDALRSTPAHQLHASIIERPPMNLPPALFNRPQPLMQAAAQGSNLPPLSSHFPQVPYFSYMSATLNICPEKFFFYNYDPFIVAGRVFADDFGENSSFSSIDGPVWQIFKQSYDKCCPFNRMALRTVHLKDDFALYQRLFSSFGTLNSSVFGQGAYATLEFMNQFQQFDANTINPTSVPVLSSPGFYLINKRDLNGASTVTPIALQILLNMWPLFVITILANAYAAIFIWIIDKTTNTDQFPQKFIKGFLESSWWTCLFFTTNGATSKLELKKSITKAFTLIWSLISLLIVIIFIAMFTTSLTVYALNGQSLSKKLIGLPKYSSDRLWLDVENAIAIEYESIDAMLKDLDDYKLDYALVDQIYANFYSKYIQDKFSIMRFVSRKRTFNVALRGFHSEQVACFQNLASILSHQWVRANLSSITSKITDASKYFNVSEELLFPQRNIILLAAVGLLFIIIIIGVSWQLSCMSEPNLGSIAKKHAAAFRFPSRPILARRARPRNEIAIDRIFAQHQQQQVSPKSQNTPKMVPNMQAPPPVNILNDEAQDRTVKFNPLVHNIYYNTNSADDLLNNQLNRKSALSTQHDITISSQNKTNNFYKVSEHNEFHPGTIIKEQAISFRSEPNFVSTEKSQVASSSQHIIKIPTYSTISIVTPPVAKRNKSIQTPTVNSATIYNMQRTENPIPVLISHVKNNSTSIMESIEQKLKTVQSIQQAISLKNEPKIEENESNTDDIVEANMQINKSVTSNANRSQNNTLMEVNTFSNLFNNTQSNKKLKTIDKEDYNGNTEILSSEASDEATTASATLRKDDVPSPNPNATASIMSNGAPVLINVRQRSNNHNEAFCLTEFANVKL